MRLRIGRHRPAPAPAAGFEIRLERDRYAPGETVAGSVAVGEGTEEEGGAAEPRVWLSFHERSPECEAVTDTVPGVVLERVELPGGSARRFAVELPEDAPPSQASIHGELWWTVDAGVDGSGRDTVASSRIEVGPIRERAV